MGILNNKGKTLIEMLVVVLILGIIGAIAYPMIFMNQKITTDQINESAKRNEIRSLENFLKEDLRNSKSFIKNGSEEDYIYTVELLSSSKIQYKKLITTEGKQYISRELGTEVVTFPEVIDIEISKNASNSKLVEVIITSTDPNGKPYTHELKIARWEWLIDKKIPGGSYVDFLINESYIMGTGILFGGGSINGPGSTIILNGNLDGASMNDDSDILVTNIFIKGYIKTNGSQALGSPDSPGNIIVNEFVDISTGDSGDIYGDLYVRQTLKISSNQNVYGKVFVKGDFTYAGGANFHEDVYVGGNLYFNHADSEIRVKKNIYVKGNVYINTWFTGFSLDSTVYYGGTVTFPNEYPQSEKNKFVKKDQQFIEGHNNIKEIPNYSIPKPKDQDWYSSKKYTNGGDLITDAKIVSLSGYSFTHSNWPKTGPYDNVVIVALTGDIIIDLGYSNPISGVLFAPNGKIEIKNVSSQGANAYGFTGLAIAKNGFTSNTGGLKILFKSLAEFTGTGPGKIFKSSDDYPFKLE